MSKDYSPEAIKARNQLVKPAQYVPSENKYICPHCGSEIPIGNIAFGYDCKECGLPFNER